MLRAIGQLDTRDTARTLTNTVAATSDALSNFERDLTSSTRSEPSWH
jgi:hypothetical protein